MMVVWVSCLPLLLHLLLLTDFVAATQQTDDSMMCRCESQYEDLYSNSNSYNNRRLEPVNVFTRLQGEERRAPSSSVSAAPLPQSSVSSPSSSPLSNRAKTTISQHVEDAVQSGVYAYQGAGPESDGYYYNTLTGVRILPKTDPYCIGKMQTTTATTASKRSSRSSSAQHQKQKRKGTLSRTSFMEAYHRLFSNRRRRRQLLQEDTATTTAGQQQQQTHVSTTTAKGLLRRKVRPPVHSSSI